MSKKETADYERYDDYDSEATDRAFKATNEQFGTTVGSATLNDYTPEQAVFFARIFFNNPNIIRAEIIAEYNARTGFNTFYIGAWVN